MTDRGSRRVICSNRIFREQFSKLSSGDCLVGQLNLKTCEESVFLYLVERGIILIPPALSQQLSRSKCLQALVYREFMVPGTTVIRCRRDLAACLEKFSSTAGRIITKQDRLDCGLGINLWHTLEEVFNAACFNSLNFPFVLQPFIKDARDIRVIIINKYIEAYWRDNPNSFRNNLHFGGNSREHHLTSPQLEFCTQVMKRGKFPYAHLDLLVTPQGEFYLSEISLRGGIKGARISPADYRERIESIHRKFIKNIEPIRKKDVPPDIQLSLQGMDNS